MSSKKCPRCENRKLYKVRRGKKRCSRCGYEFKQQIVKRIKLTDKQWEEIIEWFLLERSGLWAAEKMGLGKNLVYKAFGMLRKIMVKDVPGIFSGIVEVDETYLGGQKKNKRKSQLKKEKEVLGKESKRGFGTTKQPVFGILCRSGKIFARLVEDTKAKDLIPIITKKVTVGSKICSDTYNSYTGLATRGYIHRTVRHKDKEYVKGKNHINGLEGFWGYLKRKLAAKGGVRRKYLYLFLGEYIWRYNHRNLKYDEQIKRLFVLLKSSG